MWGTVGGKLGETRTVSICKACVFLRWASTLKYKALYESESHVTKVWIIWTYQRHCGIKFQAPRLTSNNFGEIYSNLPLAIPMDTIVFENQCRSLQVSKTMANNICFNGGAQLRTQTHTQCMRYAVISPDTPCKVRLFYSLLKIITEEMWRVDPQATSVCGLKLLVHEALSY